MEPAGRSRREERKWKWGVPAPGGKTICPTPREERALPAAWRDVCVAVETLSCPALSCLCSAISLMQLRKLLFVVAIPFVDSRSRLRVTQRTRQVEFSRNSSGIGGTYFHYGPIHPYIRATFSLGGRPCPKCFRDTTV